MSEKWINPAHLTRCEGKFGHLYMRQAEKAAQRASKKTGDLIIAYECPDCGMHHIGHTDMSQRLARTIQVPSTVAVDFLCCVCGKGIPLVKVANAKVSSRVAAYCSPACRSRAKKKRKCLKAQFVAAETVQAGQEFGSECCNALQGHHPNCPDTPA